MNKQQRDLLLEEMDLLIETLTEQFAQAKGSQGIIPLIEVDLMKITLQRLYQQLNYLSAEAKAPVHPAIAETVNPLVKVEEVIVQKAHTIIAAVTPPTPEKTPETPVVETAAAESFDYPEADTHIFTDPGIAFADILMEVEKNTPPAISEAPYAENRRAILNEEKPSPEPAPVFETPIAIAPVESPKMQTVKAEPAKAKAATASLFDEPVTSTVANQYKEQDTVHKKIAVTHDDQRLAGKLQNQPLVDLKKSIGINERFSFINELFNGNQQRYSESIETLNQAVSYEEANRFLHEELAAKLNWNSDSKAYHQLDNLVKRRFSVG